MSIPSIVYKAHATGNDFVVYLDAEGTYEPTVDEVRFLCDRHFGIGGTGYCHKLSCFPRTGRRNCVHACSRPRRER